MYIPVFTCLLSDSVSSTLVRYSVLQVSAQLTVWPMASSVLVSAITLHLCQLLCNCLSVACTANTRHYRSLILPVSTDLQYTVHPVFLDIL